MTIYASHGIVNDFSSDKFCHKFLLDWKNFEDYIKHKKNKYVTLEEALDNKGDAFTIDDATRASYDAAKLLRNYGHEVTLFINPFYIENQIDYWLFKMNALLDLSSCNRATLKDKEHILSNNQEKLLFRNKVKMAIAGFPMEEERQHILGEIFHTSIEAINVPFHLKTITQSDVLELFQLGVNIQNHGWTHRQLKNASKDDIKNEIILGKEWISKKLQYEPHFYAVPYGSFFPSDDLLDIAFWFLLEGSCTPGFKNEKTYNRKGFNLI